MVCVGETHHLLNIWLSSERIPPLCSSGVSFNFFFSIKKDFYLFIYLFCMAFSSHDSRVWGQRRFTDNKAHWGIDLWSQISDLRFWPIHIKVKRTWPHVTQLVMWFAINCNTGNLWSLRRYVLMSNEFLFCNMNEWIKSWILEKRNKQPEEHIRKMSQIRKTQLSMAPFSRENMSQWEYRQQK